MKAIVLKYYGSTDNLVLTEVAKPIPEPNQVLVKIHSTSVNDWDWGITRGSPLYMRLFVGLLRPKIEIPGVDIAGTVEAVGAEVPKFQVGDKVYGDLSESNFGGFAEYVCAGEKDITLMPKGMSFNDAAALPHAAALAGQGLVDLGQVKPGQKVLINGAGGGVGTIGVQYLKAIGCEVTGVDSANKLQMMRDCGFDHVIDYRQEDFTKQKALYDLVLDTKTTRAFYRYPRALKPGGKYITVGGDIGKVLLIAILSGVVRLFTGKTIRLLGLKPNKGFEFVEKLYSEQKLNLVIDGPYKLADTALAVQHFGVAEHHGKVIIEVD